MLFFYWMLSILIFGCCVFALFVILSDFLVAMFLSRLLLFFVDGFKILRFFL
jgi:hypothetical protein